MNTRKNRSRKLRFFWRNIRREGVQRADRWPDWKKDIRIVKYISLLK
jgi:hypothetical protein